VYEVVIPVAPKDINKVQHAVGSAIQHLHPSPAKIHIICPENIRKNIILAEEWECIIHDESQVMPLNPTQSRFRRPQWIYQQFIKLFNDVTSTDHYMVIDSDLIFNKDIDVYADDERPQFFLGLDQNHGPDFAFLREMFGFGRVYPYAFTTEFMLISKKIRNEIWRFWGSVENFYNKTCELINEDGKPYRINDYETYGNFTVFNHPNAYAFKHIKSKLFALENRDWLPHEIMDLKMKMLNTDYDIFTYHTWI